jgi:cytochrome c biogenesis protein CcmG, thiol:disulfide interchange protein DsbE
MRKLFLWTPFVFFVGLFLVFATGLLSPVDRSVPSGLVGRQMPQFDLPGMIDPAQHIGASYLSNGKPKILNIFASWCLPCVQEAPALLELQKQGVEIVGIAIHDKPEALQKFLSENGNPYSQIGDDADSRTQITLGSAGVPETFVVDGKGVIRHQHIGIIKPNDVPILMAKLKASQ